MWSLGHVIFGHKIVYEVHGTQNGLIYVKTVTFVHKRRRDRNNKYRLFKYCTSLFPHKTFLLSRIDSFWNKIIVHIRTMAKLVWIINASKLKHFKYFIILVPWFRRPDDLKLTTRWYKNDFQIGRFPGFLEWSNTYLYHWRTFRVCVGVAMRRC